MNFLAKTLLPLAALLPLPQRPTKKKVPKGHTPRLSLKASPQKLAKKHPFYRVGLINKRPREKVYFDPLRAENPSRKWLKNANSPTEKALGNFVIINGLGTFASGFNRFKKPYNRFQATMGGGKNGAEKKDQAPRKKSSLLSHAPLADPYIDLEKVRNRQVQLRKALREGKKLPTLDALKGYDFRDQNLDDLDLSGLDLRGANFEGTTLKGVNFSGCTLDGANFQGAKLNACNFNVSK